MLINLFLFFVFIYKYYLFSFSVSSDAFDTEQLLLSMEKLKHGQAVNISKYDFRTYKTDVSKPRKVSLFKLEVVNSRFKTPTWVTRWAKRVFIVLYYSFCSLLEVLITDVHMHSIFKKWFSNFYIKPGAVVILLLSMFIIQRTVKNTEI